MLKVGITGGIGSGKTTICKIFEVLGIPIYYSDDRAKQLMITNAAIREGIIELFGNNAYTEGQLNRKHIAKLAFSKPELLQKLNGIVHPAVGHDTLVWQREQEKKGAPYSIKEAALIFESNSHKQLDKVITVIAPENIRIERVVNRDGRSENEIRKIIAKQIPDEEKIELSDYIIYNDGKRSIIQQVWNLHQQLLELSV